MTTAPPCTPPHHASCFLAYSNHDAGSQDGRDGKSRAWKPETWLSMRTLPSPSCRAWALLQAQVCLPGGLTPVLPASWGENIPIKHTFWNCKSPARGLSSPSPLPLPVLWVLTSSGNLCLVQFGSGLFMSPCEVYFPWQLGQAVPREAFLGARELAAEAPSSIPAAAFYQISSSCLTSSAVDRDAFILLMPLLVTVFNEETFQGIFWTCEFWDKNNSFTKSFSKTNSELQFTLLNEKKQKSMALLLGQIFSFNTSQLVPLASPRSLSREFLLFNKLTLMYVKPSSRLLLFPSKIGSPDLASQWIPAPSLETALASPSQLLTACYAAGYLWPG